MLDPCVTVDAVEGQREHTRADQDENHETRELCRRVHRLFQQRQAEPPLGERQQNAARRAHGTGFGRRCNAHEDRAQHKEDQRQRRHQHDDDLLGHARHQAQIALPVRHGEQVEQAGRNEGAPDQHIVGRHVGEACIEPIAQQRGSHRRNADHRECVPARHVISLARAGQATPEHQQRGDDATDPLGGVGHFEGDAREATDPFREADDEVEQRHADKDQREAGQPFLARFKGRIFGDRARLERQGGGHLRLHDGDEEDIARVKGRQGEPRNEGTLVHVAHRAAELVGHDDEHERGRNDLRQRARCRNDAGRETPVIAVAQHDRQRDQAHRDH